MNFFDVKTSVTFDSLKAPLREEILFSKELSVCLDTRKSQENLKLIYSLTVNEIEVQPLIINHESP